MKLVSNIISGKDRHILFCPKCYTDGSSEMAAGARFMGASSAVCKNLACNQCMNKECPLSLVNKYVGECSCGGKEPFDHRISKYAAGQGQQCASTGAA